MLTDTTASYKNEIFKNQLFFRHSIGVLYALIFGQVTNIISQLQKSSNEFTDKMGSIKNFNTIYKMPPKVAKRLEDYFVATWNVTKGTDEQEVRAKFKAVDFSPFLRTWTLKGGYLKKAWFMTLYGTLVNKLKNSNLSETENSLALKRAKRFKKLEQSVWKKNQIV